MPSPATLVFLFRKSRKSPSRALPTLPHTRFLQRPRPAPSSTPRNALAPSLSSSASLWLFSLAAVRSAPPMNWILFATAAPATLAAILLLSNYSVRLIRGDLVSSLKKKFAEQGVQADGWNGV